MSDQDFVSFVAVTRPTLRRKAYALCGDWHEADDLVQTVLIKLHQHWARLERRDELSGYLHRMLVRAVISSRRGAVRAREVLPGELPEPEPAPAAQDRVPDRLVLADALARLGNRQREAVVLRYVERLSAEEVAAALGCSPSTVRSQSSRGLANLRKLLCPGTAKHGTEYAVQRFSKY